MCKDKQMLIVIYYHLETSKSRNFLGIQISKVNFFILSLQNYSPNVMKNSLKNPTLLHSPYYVSLEVLMSNNYKVLLYSFSLTQIIGKDFKIL